MKYIIWHDNDFDLAIWLYKNTILKNYQVELRSIPKTNSPSQIEKYFRDDVTREVMPFIRFETPDVIIQMVEPINKVVCVTELMTHTPQWQHPAQRFTRLYTSTILGIPTALILPEFKSKWEKGNNTNYKKVSYRCSGSVYRLFYEATIKGGNPTLIFHWPQKDGYLKYDMASPTSPFIEGDVSKWLLFVNACISKNGKLDASDFQERVNFMSSKMDNPTVDTFDTIKGIVKTEDFIKTYKLDRSKLDKAFLENEDTLVFKPNGLKCSSSAFRTDPYAGMLCAFDVMFCRDNNFKRKINLVLEAKDVEQKNVNYIETNHNDYDCPFMQPSIPITLEHLKKCPYTQPKYRRIYGEIADLVIFDDGVIMKKGEKI